MIQNPPPYPIVEVIWNDHRDKSDSDWEPLEEIVSSLTQPIEVHSFGYVVQETDTYVIIATTVDIKSETLDTAYAIKILKGTILSINKL